MTVWNNHNNYSGDDVLRMQQDAINRVLEMQRRASEKIQQTNNFDGINPIPIRNRPNSKENVIDFEQPPNSFSEEPIRNEEIDPPSKSPTLSLKEIFKSLDTEKLIILGLIVLLYNEGEDKTLLIALGYLLF